MRETDPRRDEEDWWVGAFDELYPLLYRHRDFSEADRLLACLAKIAPLDEGRLLDLGCGTGRHLRLLGQRGIRGVGLDYAGVLLRQARAIGNADLLVQGDMRRLPFRRSSFAWVLMMFTTFGYFRSDEENLRVLCAVAELLRAGGRLVLDFLNAGTLRAGLVESSRREIEGYRLQERRWIDEAGPFVRKETRIVSAAGRQERLYRERVRLYEPGELERLIADAGMRIDRRIGDYDGGIFDPARSARLILVARREEQAA